MIQKIDPDKIKKTVPNVWSFAERGFTLVEVMVVVAIIALMALFAAPEMINFGPNTRVKAAARDLHGSLQKMKIEAAKRNSDVIMLITPVICGGLPNAVPSPGGTIQIFIDNGEGAGGIAGDGIQNGTEEWLRFSDDSDDAQPDTDYDMPKNTALCGSTSGSMGYNSRGIFLDPTTNVELLPSGQNGFLFTLNNDKGRIYTVSVSISGVVKTQKL